MVFVLPDERDGLASVEAKMAQMDMKQLDQRLRSVEIQVEIPKFRLEESLELVDILQQVRSFILSLSPILSLSFMFSLSLSLIPSSLSLYHNKGTMQNSIPC